MYYNANDIINYKELYKIIISNRGLGKTFAFKVLSINDFIRHGWQFVYIRRYKTEHKNIKLFFDDIQLVNQKLIDSGKKPLFPKDTILQVTGSYKEGSGKFYINGKIAGCWLTASISSSYKSTPFPKVETIIFDEFLIKKSNYHYLQDDVGTFEDLVETIFRNREPRRGVIMLANNISWYNPYFVAWKIKPFNTEFYRPSNDSIVVQFPDYQDFKDFKYSTRLGQHLKNTTYGKYSIENESLTQKSPFILHLNKNCKPFFNVIYSGSKYCFYLDTNEDKLIFSNKIDPSNKFTYALTTSDHCLNTYYIKNRKNCQLAYINHYYELARLFAENDSLAQVLDEILKILL